MLTMVANGWRGLLFVVVAIGLVVAIVLPAFEAEPPNLVAIVGFSAQGGEGEVLVLVESVRPLAEELDGTKIVVRTDALRCPDESLRGEDEAFLGKTVTVELDPIPFPPRDVLPTILGTVTLESC